MEVGVGWVGGVGLGGGGGVGVGGEPGGEKLVLTQ